MHFKTIILILLLLPTGLLADEKNYLQGVEYLDAKDYSKAFPIILKEARANNQEAQYRLAEMYANAQGTQADFEQAAYWYKQAASAYVYVDKENVQDTNSSYWSDISSQIGNDSIRAGNEYTLAKLDVNTPETKRLLASYQSGGFFGLQAYQTNFILPISYGKAKPPRVSSSIHPNNYTPAMEPYTDYDKNMEVEFQLSLKKLMSYNLFGLHEFIYAGYTQKVWWQLYTDSGPFRETNYLPELFVTVPTLQKVDDTTGLKAIKLGFLHESNGQEGYRSRSWNRLYATGVWQWGNLFLETRAWYRLNEDEKSEGYYEGLTADPNESGDDNPDIEKYLGYGDLKLGYLYGNSQFGMLIRNNLRLSGDNKGAIELNYTYPMFRSPNTFLYVKLFNGYGESLIDYNRKVTKAAIGFSFSRGLF